MGDEEQVSVSECIPAVSMQGGVGLNARKQCMRSSCFTRALRISKG